LISIKKRGNLMNKITIKMRILLLATGLMILSGWKAKKRSKG